MKKQIYTVVGSEGGDNLVRLMVESTSVNELLNHFKNWNFYDIYIGEHHNFPILSRKIASK